jgi:predicted Zn-dependent protease
LRRARDLSPNSIRFGLVYAVALHDTGESAKAIAVLSRVHERFDGDRTVTDLLARYRSENGTPRSALIAHPPP